MAAPGRPANQLERYAYDRYDKPATARQVAEITRLAAKLGLLPPKPGLSWDEADIALRALHKRNDRGEAFPPPADDPSLQPGETLRDWITPRKEAPDRSLFGKRLG